LLDTALNAVGLEVILVDVSPDGTAERIRYINRRGRRVWCLQRMGRLASPPPASKGLGQHPPVQRRYRCRHAARDAVAADAGDPAERAG